jgi:phage terminase large subunit-like protein
VALVGQTMADVRDVMVEGESGLLAVCARYGLDAKYNGHRRRVEFANGAMAYCYSSEKPRQLRGPQHECLWGDELAQWYNGEETFSNADMGLRLGTNPQGILTFTPKPVPLVKSITEQAQSSDGDVVLTRGTTWENRDNLPDVVLHRLEHQYAGTRFGRQELGGELLEDVEGALWSATLIAMNRLADMPTTVTRVRVVVGVDPKASSNAASETGIIVAALGSDDHAYVLADMSIDGSPNEWGTEVVKAYDQWEADHVTPEVNNGGDMVSNTIRTVRKTIPINPVWASRGKVTRAEPVSALYEQGKVHHVGLAESFEQLENQMTTWVPGMASPDRMDALVWAITDLMLDTQGEFQELPGAVRNDLQALGLG